jgi:hypothetical protein
MYINAVANSVTLYLQHDFYNIIFKIKHKLYIASGSAPHQGKILDVHLAVHNILDWCSGLSVHHNDKTSFCPHTVFCQMCSSLSLGQNMKLVTHFQPVSELRYVELWNKERFYLYMIESVTIMLFTEVS